MAIPSSNYREAIGTPTDNLTLSDRVKRIGPEYQAKFITNILYGKEDSFMDWLQQEPGFPPHYYRLYAPNDLLFHWLLQQEASWLNEHAETFANCWEEVWQRKEEEQQACYDRLTTLVDTTRAGFDLSYFKEFLEEHDLEGFPKVEIDVYLMIAKIEEKQNLLQPGSSFWNQWHYREAPHFAIVDLYLYRHQKPDFFFDKIWNLDDALTYLRNQGKGAFKRHRQVLEQLEPYFMSYLQRSIYLYLRDEQEATHYHRFRTWRNSLQNEWTLELLGDILEQPVMEKIKVNLHQQQFEMYGRTDRASHRDALQQVNRKILED